MSHTVVAKECNSEEILKLVNAGYDKQKIDSICNKTTDSIDNDIKPLHQDLIQTAKIDSWFAKFGVGLVSITYPNELQNEVDTLESLSYVDRTKLAIDMGIYFSITNKYMAGFNINGHSDTLKNINTNAEIHIGVYNYALSNIYYINQIEDGVFLRADIGISKGVVSATGYEDSVSDSGLGLAAGLGYCFNLKVVSLQTEVLLTNYTVENDTVQSAQLLFSLLF